MTKGSLVRFGVLFLFPNVVFAACALLTPPPFLIAAFNSMLACLSIGVCVAYFPVIKIILFDPVRPIDRPDFLAIGIFCSWFGIVTRTIWSIAWRYSGQPDSWTNTNFTGYFIFLSICAAIFHLMAPGAVGERIPTKQWIKIGAMCAFGLMALVAVTWYTGILPTLATVEN